MRTLLYPTMLVTLLLAVACPHSLAETPDAQMLLTHLDISKGICAVPNCGKGDLAIEIAKQSGFLVHGFDTDQTNINEAINRAASSEDARRPRCIRTPSESTEMGTVQPHRQDL